MNRYDCHEGEAGLDVADDGELIYYEEHMVVVRELKARLDNMKNSMLHLAECLDQIESGEYDHDLGHLAEHARADLFLAQE